MKLLLWGLLMLDGSDRGEATLTENCAVVDLVFEPSGFQVQSLCPLTTLVSSDLSCIVNVWKHSLL